MFGRHGQAMERAERAVDLARELGNPDALHWAFMPSVGRWPRTARSEPVKRTNRRCPRREGSTADSTPVSISSNGSTSSGGSTSSNSPRRAAGLLDLLAVSGNRSQLSQALRQAGLVLASTGQREVAAIRCSPAAGCRPCQPGCTPTPTTRRSSSNCPPMSARHGPASRPGPGARRAGAHRSVSIRTRRDAGATVNRVGSRWLRRPRQARSSGRRRGPRRPVTHKTVGVSDHVDEAEVVVLRRSLADADGPKPRR